MFDAQINILAIIVSALVSMVLGFAWYSQALFGKAWIAAMGFTPETMAKNKQRGMAKILVVNAIATLVMAWVFAMLNYNLGNIAVRQGVATGFWVWLGFVAPVLLNDVLFGGRKLQAFFINAGYQLVALLAMGAILAFWI